ncbi:hypothetical protein BSKO_11905 [Bryopsis sp. KO-2023]|nr:hypothetical protein BSKO_11905 [Bryopsis sp. KO-2023]
MELLRSKHVSTGTNPASVTTTNGEYLAFATQPANAVQICYLKNLTAPPLDVSVPASKVISLKLGNIPSDVSDDLHLFIGTNRGVFACDVNAAYSAALEEASPPELLLLPPRRARSVHFIGLCPRSGLLAACSDDLVSVTNLNSHKVEFLLEGHAGAVGAASFCDFWDGLLVTGGDDRTFKLWNLVEGEMVHDSGILGTAAVTAICMDPSSPRMAVGSADGTVHIYDLANLPECRRLQASCSAKKGGIQGVLQTSPRLIVVCPSALVLYDSRSYECPGGWTFGDTGDEASQNSTSPGDQSMTCHQPLAIGPNKPNSLRLRWLSLGNDAQACVALKTEKSYFAADDRSKTSTQKQRKDKSKPGNQPVTFHKKVKSSGYGYVFPKTKFGKRPTQPVKVEVGRKAHSNASLLATSSSDRTARLLRLPLSRHQGEGTNFVGFDGAPTDICWNHNDTLLLTPSSDRTAYLWDASQSTPLLHFTHEEQSIEHDDRPIDLKRCNRPFASDVVAAKFMLLDGIVLLGVGNKLHAYNYNMIDREETKDDDIMRFRSADNRYLRIGTICLDSHNLTSLDCPNSFISHIALAGGSNKSISVIDIGEEKIVHTYERAHQRPVHRIKMFGGSASSNHASHSDDAYELFATSSPENEVRLWDLRAKDSVRCFSSHQKRGMGCDIDISPCFRYMAAASDDRSIYLYDIGSGSVVKRVTDGLSDSVSAVAFNPLFPQLVGATSDGRLHFFSDAL